MKITRGVKHHISMGAYSWVEVEASVEIDDQAVPSLSVSNLLNHFDRASELLSRALGRELHDAAQATSEPNSYIFNYAKEN